MIIAEQIHGLLAKDRKLLKNKDLPIFSGEIAGGPVVFKI